MSCRRHTIRNYRVLLLRGLLFTEPHMFGAAFSLQHLQKQSNEHWRPQTVQTDSSFVLKTARANWPLGPSTADFATEQRGPAKQLEVALRVLAHN